MIRKQKSIEGKNEIKELLKSLKKTSKSTWKTSRSTCCSCGDVIRLFVFDCNCKMIAPSHTNSDLTEICDECFYNQNVIKDDDILIYYNEEDIEFEKNHQVYSYYIFDFNTESEKPYYPSYKLPNKHNNMIYMHFRIGV
jgi:hypothetical protein